MVPLVVVTAFILGDAGDACPPTFSGSIPATEEVFRVGQIYIEGADDMTASAILNLIDFHYGDRIPYRWLSENEHRLTATGPFVVDTHTDVRPRIVLGV